MTTYIGITRILALAGVTDFSWVDEEARWRGSEVHRAVALADRQSLDWRSVPKRLDGFVEAHFKFMKETGFIPTHIEHAIKSKELGIRGRIDRIGLLHGKRVVLDLKTGTLDAAVGLQLALYGHLFDPKAWWKRIGVRLSNDGTYTLKIWGLTEWHADLNIALCAVKLAKWKIAHGCVRSKT